MDGTKREARDGDAMDDCGTQGDFAQQTERACDVMIISDDDVFDVPRAVNTEDNAEDDEDSDDDVFEDVPRADTADDSDDDEFEDVPQANIANDSDEDSDSMPELGTIEVTIGDDPGPRKRRAVVTQRARLIRRSHHKTYLIVHLLSSQLLNHVCTQPETLSRCLSLIPIYTIDRINQHLVPNRREIRRDWASSDLHYFLSSFQALKFKYKRGESLGVEQGFWKFVETRVARRAWHVPMLVVCMLRVLAFDARLCVGIRPPELKVTVRESVEIEQRYKSDVTWTGQVQGAELDAYRADELNKGLGELNKGLGELNNGLGELIEDDQKWWQASVPQYWCEVFDQVSEQWLAINARTGTIERPTRLLSGANRGPCKYPYIIGINGTNGVVDITRRYTRDFVNNTRKRRLESSRNARDSVWWAQWIERWEQRTERDTHEAAELARRTERSTMPRRIADFASNPYYVLQRNLTQHEMIVPNSPVVGTIRGECVYLRTHVQKVCSRMAWRRTGRQVRDQEQPVKHTTSTRRGIECVSEMYGEWQTQVICPQPVVHGRVPRNEYGNVDLFVPEMLPRGGAHVRDPGARSMCKVLDIDCADAVVGFEFRRGATVPVIDGVVIAAESRDMLLDALREDRRIAAASARAAAEARAVQRWRRLLVALRVRAEVDSTFATRSSQLTTFTTPNTTFY
ncbi:hypothetical protein IWW56_002996 [Coemansia sp. RSA 2131]|nr:hypothetical protein IWW56_002996 [Coemansia sp. RSA 2131]